MTMTDTLIFAPYILPMTETPVVLRDYALHIRQREIIDIIPQEKAQSIAHAQRVSLPNHVLMPGLINLHGHSAMTLLRGYADDLVLMDWLNQHIWPAEGQFADGAFVYDGTLIA
ncbi:MAG: TRZ/ATZ family hydrolase, partial [Neisseriaceae bacterium]|nr:TRZ/ATZ family hydrolase [Neisseriaceae bacterium]